MTDIEIRAYRATDEEQWLRCRVLAFLGTSYFDDVDREKPVLAGDSIELVAVMGDAVVGVLDAELDGAASVIDTVAVHPDHRGRGVGRLLVETLLGELRDAGVTSVDAWTRDDPEALGWYRALGFDDHDHYLHVYVDGDEASDAVKPLVGGRVRKAFLHADLADEERMRATFRRVYVCRRFNRPVG